MHPYNHQMPLGSFVKGDELFKLRSSGLLQVESINTDISAYGKISQDEFLEVVLSKDLIYIVTQVSNKVAFTLIYVTTEKGSYQMSQKFLSIITPYELLS